MGDEYINDFDAAYQLVWRYAASVAETIPNFSAKERKNFETSLLLGIAYAASIGGMSTLVGTAPNIIFVGFIQETYGIEISFVDWMKLGVPLAILDARLHPGMQLQK